MKRLFFALLLLSSLTPSVATADEIKEGTKASSSNYMWVTIRNDRIVHNADRHFENVKSCVTNEGGTLTVTKIDAPILVVQYQIEGKQYEWDCPSGTIFFTTQERFKGLMPANIDQKTKPSHKRGGMFKGEDEFHWYDLIILSMLIAIVGGPMVFASIKFGGGSDKEALWSVMFISVGVPVFMGISFLILGLP